MRVLFLDAYFKPEKISGAHLAEDVRQALAATGHTMQIYVPTPSRGISKEVRKEYKKRKKETELNGSVSIHRFALYKEGKNPLARAFRYVLCELQLFRCALFAKAIDIMPLGSTPPINGLMGTLIHKLRGIPMVYIVQDLFPDSLVSTGMTKKGSFLWKIGSWVSNLTYRNAAHIIVISESIKTALIERGVPEEKISVIYNWIDTEKTCPVPRENNTLFAEFNLPKDKFYVTYAGNLGKSQNVELLVDCAERLKDQHDIQFVIFGDGSEKEALLRRIKESQLDNIRIFPMQPIDRVSEVYSLGDASFVICKKGVGGGAFPSKAASIMATGTPVIASFDLDSDLCRIIREHDAGECCEAENAEQTVQAIQNLYAHRELCHAYGQNARDVACEIFAKDVSVTKRIHVYEKYAKNKKNEG